jgi:5'-methylthioadenosine phosphorylase
MSDAAPIGIIGGSGLYRMAGLEVVDEVAVETPFGPPSDKYVIGELAGARVAFLPRHGRAHSILPGELNFRANIFGFKALGVQRVVSISAVGSMKEGIEPLHIVLPDQFIDRTRGRTETFFGRGIVAHVSLADPVCPELHAALKDATARCGVKVWPNGTYVCIEGPTFSTRAESHLYRSWGVSVIGMTNLPEAKLAREAELCYATMALVTDYDCWHEEEEPVSGEMVLENLMRNVETAQQAVAALVSTLPARRGCSCGDALRTSLVTPLAEVPAHVRQELDIIIGKYVE